MHADKVRIVRDSEFQLAPKEVLLLTAVLGISAYLLGFLVGLTF